MYLIDPTMVALCQTEWNLKIFVLHSAYLIVILKKITSLLNLPVQKILFHFVTVCQTTLQMYLYRSYHDSLVPDKEKLIKSIYVYRVHSLPNFRWCPWCNGYRHRK